MKTIHVRYYAMLREERGAATETIRTAARTVAELYGELRRRHGLSWPRGKIKFAVNDDLKGQRAGVQAGDTVSFLPPVAGG